MGVTLSSEELAAARKAYGQNRDYDHASRKRSLLLPLLCTLPFVLITLDEVSRGNTGHLPIFALIMFVWLPLCLLARFWRMHYLKSSYAENLHILEGIKQKYGQELSLGIYQGVMEEHPLLECWNRRLEKRPILWRLDAFLSRKSVSG